MRRLGTRMYVCWKRILIMAQLVTQTGTTFKVNQSCICQINGHEETGHWISSQLVKQIRDKVFSRNKKHSRRQPLFSTAHAPSAHLISLTEGCFDVLFKYDVFFWENYTKSRISVINLKGTVSVGFHSITCFNYISPMVHWICGLTVRLEVGHFCALVNPTEDILTIV